MFTVAGLDIEFTNKRSTEISFLDEIAIIELLNDLHNNFMKAATCRPKMSKSDSPGTSW